MSNTANTAAKIIAAVLAVALIAGGIGIIYKYTNGFNEDFKTFYVEYDGKQILTENITMTFGADTEPKFSVKYTFDGSDEKRDYSVKVTANASIDFEYTVDGERYLYSKTKDLSDAFGIDKQSDGFTLHITNELNIQNVLRRVCGSNDATVPRTVESIEYPYMLVITSYNGNVKYNIAFGIADTVRIEYPTPDGGYNGGITLNYTAIAF